MDLEKTYDRLEWDFIRESLEFFQLPPNLITLIMNMVSSTHFHILWNGGPLPEIVLTRGVRQGDLLSPYLFILCLERLSIRLEEAVRDKLIHPMSFRGRVRLSHLFFADDIFLFTKATLRDYRHLNLIFQTFCASSGQIMIASKSCIWFSPRIPRSLKDQVFGIFGIPTTDRIGTYLGTPIFTTRRTMNSYQFLVDKIQKHIEG